MKFDVIESKKNDLLGRTEVTGKVTFSGATPKRGEVLKAVCASTKSKQDLTVVKKIDVHYGGGEALVTAFAYSDKALFEKVEREYMRTRNVIKEEPKEEAPEPAESSEEKTESAPAEEPKEEEKPAEETPKEDSQSEGEEATEEKPAVETPEEKEAAPEKPAEEEKSEEAPAEKKEDGD